MTGTKATPTQAGDLAGNGGHELGEEKIGQRLVDKRDVKGLRLQGQAGLHLGLGERDLYGWKRLFKEQEIRGKQDNNLKAISDFAGNVYFVILPEHCSPQVLPGSRTPPAGQTRQCGWKPYPARGA